MEATPLVVEKEMLRVSSSQGLPGPQELYEMMRADGLAKVVENVQAQTGWSFQDAAKYVAEQLRKG